MLIRKATACAIVSILLLTGISFGKVEFTQSGDRLEIRIDGNLFTEYRYAPDLVKPILYPVQTPSGLAVNRGYPFVQIQGETQDHPHHQGIFFTYDITNAENFWGSTKTLPTIKHKRFLKREAGQKQGVLSAVLDWVGKNGRVLVEENRTMVFYGQANAFVLDFTATLTATDSTVAFQDTKEGMFAIRTADWLRERGGTGRYLNSRDQETAKQCWGVRAEWVRLEGNKDGAPVGIVIFNHPASVNFPTYWHARDYGLFSANPLGQGAFQTENKVAEPQPFRLTLQPKQNAVFKFLVVVYDGTRTKEELNNLHETYKKK
jgi:hypothetical protein